jgi:hypothetical protein
VVIAVAVVVVAVDIAVVVVLRNIVLNIFVSAVVVFLQL